MPTETQLIRVALFTTKDTPGGAPTRTYLGAVELTVPRADVHHRIRWYYQLRDKLTAQNLELDSLSELQQPHDGCPWAAIVRMARAVPRKRPVTRGGLAVDLGERKPTMAARRRRGR